MAALVASGVRPRPRSAETARGSDFLAPRLASAAAKILSFREFRNPAGTTLGYFDIETPSGMQLFGCKLMTGPKGKRWVAPPSIMRHDKDGHPVLNERGKPAWDPIVDFRDRKARDRFNAMVLAALRAERPELFEGAPS